MMRLSFFLAAMLIVFLPAIHASAVNPYCIAGGDSRPGSNPDKIGMPTDSWAYQWGNLWPDNPVQMLRPRKNYGATADAYWAYLEASDEIVDPTRFDTWVRAYPGKAWLVGNEPNWSGQDGLTPEQYARMYHTYYSFIKGIGGVISVKSVEGFSLLSSQKRNLSQEHLPVIHKSEGNFL